MLASLSSSGGAAALPPRGVTGDIARHCSITGRIEAGQASICAIVCSH